MPTVEQILLVVLGSGLTLLVQIITSRIIESHKITLNLAAKRRERFHEKQLATIGGCYERLARCVFTINSTHIMKNDFSTYDKEYWAERLAKLTPDLTDFQVYFHSNAIYLPRPMVDRLIEFEKQLLGVHRHFLVPLVGPIVPTSVEDMRRDNESTVKLMDGIHDDFRKVMLSGED